MKLSVATLILIGIYLTSFQVKAQLRAWYSPPPPAGPSAESVYLKQLDQKKRAEEHQRWLANWTPVDPWRVIDGRTNYAKGPDWFQFVGKVVDVSRGGIRVEGVFAAPGTAEYLPHLYDYEDFWVANYPYAVVNDQLLKEDDRYTAKFAGTYTYSTVNGASRTIRKLDYGRPCGPPPLTPQELKVFAAEQEEARISAEKNKREMEARTLRWNEKQAAKGDAYGELRMGERYLRGDGVGKDTAKARMYFALSAAQGNVEASNELRTMGGSGIRTHHKPK